DGQPDLRFRAWNKGWFGNRGAHEFAGEQCDESDAAARCAGACLGHERSSQCQSEEREAEKARPDTTPDQSALAFAHSYGGAVFHRSSLGPGSGRHDWLIRGFGTDRAIFVLAMLSCYR